MASNVAKSRKRVEAETPASLKRARDGSAFARCEECKSSVPVALIDFHSCSLEARIKMNLESQVVEKEADIKKKQAEIKKKPNERKKSASTAPPESNSKKRRLTKAKDPNMPKRAPTAYFLFMDDFRKTLKEENSETKKASEVAKEAGAKWKSMSDEEKKVYIDKVAELKADYDKAMEAYEAGKADADAEENQQPEELCDEDA